jgi:hypothetical protein
MVGLLPRRTLTGDGALPDGRATRSHAFSVKTHPLPQVVLTSISWQ